MIIPSYISKGLEFDGVILLDDLKTIYIQIAQSYLTGSTANDFKTWLSNNNVDLYYILATPTTSEYLLIPPLSNGFISILIILFSP